MGLNIFSKNKERSIFSSHKHRKRLTEVARVIIKYGLDEALGIDFRSKIPILRGSRKDASVQKFSRAERVRLAIEELDGAFIKLGQLLSNRPDILPEEYIIELEKLQDRIPPISTDVIVQTVEEELNDKLASLFLMFDDEPLASGSIAQVHRAVLYDGTSVVIKVQRPGIKETFSIDLDIFIYLSKHAAKIKLIKSQFQKQNPIKDISAEIFKELDFFNELKNLKIFKKYFPNHKDMYVPDVFKSYSSKKIITMEYIEGIKVSDVSRYKEYGVTGKEIANKIVNVGIEQMFDKRFYHGDPHPGNIFIMKDKRLGYLDFGLMGRISNAQKIVIIDLISAFGSNDPKKATKIISKFIPKNESVDEAKLELQVTELIDFYFDKNLEEVNVGEALHSMIALLSDYKISLASNIYLLIKTVATYEGICKKIYPEFGIAPYAKKLAIEMMKDRLSPKAIAKDIYTSTADTIGLIKELPGQVNDLLSILQSGRLRVNAGLVDMEKVIDYAFNRLEKTLNRLTTSVILAAMILGSALVLRTGYLTYVAGVGFGISLVIGTILMISVVRNRGV